ncbi:hypothetical protein LTR56_002900 [Elasticomyces elasticus]|nr:hypothetical protein LTR56_002900 [Elasticomyces elasticus]KAK3665140.1 hypothetical protein LTR22_003947 [Elasticomyces elasticus]KAK4930687.1 hypothetical protein LTR49_002774 [Elasticomyces elasticus]KAK5759910.1 hypothetical protein LTS12_009957 [Elasticomyces elasticus]
MAVLSAAAIELANSLTIESIATKLRCANCNRLAVDAVKLPCCDSNICHPCSLDLGEACPVCQHTPVSGEDCKPNKNLRTTISAYIKTEQNKRQKAQEKEARLAAATPVAAPATSETPVPATEQNAEAHGDADGEPAAEEDTPALQRANSAQGEAEHDQESTEDAKTNGDDEATADEEYDDDDDVVITTHKPEDEPKQQAQLQDEYVEPEQGNGDLQQQQPTGANGHQQSFNNFDQNQQGGFNNGGMGFNNTNNFNPMMNGMGGMGGFGMGMGMPGMMGKQNRFFPSPSRTHFSYNRLRRGGWSAMPGMMDPMMFANAGFGGMDMSQMMMNMGPMAMGGNFGGMMGGGGGFNGGQGGFNGQNGYNNQNFGNSMNQQFRNDRGGYGGRPFNRGSARGRGFQQNAGFNRGRGGGYGGGFQNQQQNQNFAGQQQQNGQNQAMVNQQQQSGGSVSGQSQSGRRASPSYEPVNGKEANASATARDQDQDMPDPDGINITENANPTVAEGEEVTQSVEDVPPDGDVQVDGDGAAQGDATQETQNGDVDMQQQQTFPDESMPPNGTEMESPGMNGAQHHDTFDNQQSYNQNFNFGPRGRGGMRGGFRGGRGGFAPVGMQSEALDLTPAPAPPVNAPSGPKAMREGKPNAFFFARKVPTPSVPLKAVTPIAPISHREGSRSGPQERNNRDRDYDERSRSRSRHRSRKHKSGDADEGYESEESRRRRKDKERERKHRDRRDRESKYDDDDGEHSSRKGRSREESRDEGYSFRHQEKDDEPRASRTHREERRKSKRDRSRSPDRDDASMNSNGHRSSRKSKSDRGKHDERSSHRTSRDDKIAREREREKPRTIIQPESDEIGFKIKGSKSASINAAGMPPPPRRASDRHDRRSSMNGAVDSAPSTPVTGSDPYAEERERQHALRERKEQQRRQTTGGPSKRKGDEDGGVPNGPKSDQSRKRSRKERRISVKYEDEVGGGEEDRERGRWN